MNDAVGESQRGRTSGGLNGDGECSVIKDTNYATAHRLDGRVRHDGPWTGETYQRAQQHEPNIEHEAIHQRLARLHRVHLRKSKAEKDRCWVSGVAGSSTIGYVHSGGP